MVFGCCHRCHRRPQLLFYFTIMQPVLQVLFNKKILLVSWAVVAYRITFSSSSSPSPDTTFDAWNRNVFPLQFCVFHEAWSLVGSHLLRAHSCERHANMSLLIALWAVFVFLEGVGDPHPHGPVWLFPMDPLKRGLEPGKIWPKGIIAGDFLEFTFWRNFRLFAYTIRAECLFSLSRRLPKLP